LGSRAGRALSCPPGNKQRKGSRGRPVIFPNHSWSSIVLFLGAAKDSLKIAETVNAIPAPGRLLFWGMVGRSRSRTYDV
jgi:hypothetical protein